MSKFNHIKRHLDVKLAGHVVMFAFALASLANVESFFANLHPGLPLLSWGLGIALGTGLLVMAGLLSGMAWDWLDARFQVVATVAGCLALLSGGIQAAAYSGHMKSTIAAVIVGMALPIVGELGVALAVSAFSQAQRRQRMADAQTQLADGVRSQIGDAIATIDPTKIRAQVERAAALVTKAIVDSTIDDMIGELQRGRRPTSGSQTTTEPAESPQIADTERLPIAELNAERQRLIDGRQAAIISLIAAYGPLSTTELVTQLAEDRDISTSDRTVRSDCAALADAGQLVRSGRKWDRPMAIAETLPTMGQPVLNGASH